MLKIYLTRHGQNIDNKNGILNGHRDLPLTEKGIEQAHTLAYELKELELSFDAIYSSPLSRAFDTATIIAETISGPFPQKEDLLIERDFGVMAGKNIADIENLCAPDILKTETVCYFLNTDGAESYPVLMERANLSLSKIRTEHKSGNILLISHGDIGKMMYANYYGLDWEEVLKQFHFGNCDLLLLSEDSAAGDSHVVMFEQHNS